MISFRFHVVSITAVFLAIAVGVVVGSTYIDRLTVDQLESRIETVEDRANETREENERLEGDLQRAREYIDLSADFAVTSRLVDEPVLVVAARGVEEGAVEDMVLLARTAGGRVPGVVWLEPRWAGESEDDLAALSEIVDGSATDDREDLWERAWTAVAADLDGLPEVPSGEDAAAGPPGPSTLEELEAGGFVSLDSLGDDSVQLADLVGTDPRLLAVSGARAEPEAAPVMPIAVSAAVDAGLASVVADVYVGADEAPARSAVLVDAHDEALRELIVLVDHADMQEGRVAAVLALDAAADGEVGVHYGYGEGADAVLPAWSVP